MSRVAAPAKKRGESADFTGYWQTSRFGDRDGRQILPTQITRDGENG
jgi:hypothetical protein